MSDIGDEITEIDDGDLADTVRVPVRKAAVTGWLYATLSQIALYTGAKLFGSKTGNAGKVIAVNTGETAFEFIDAGGSSGIEEAPNDGTPYVRENEDWVMLAGATGGGGTLPVGAHRYWLLSVMHSTENNTFNGFAQIEFRSSVGGEDYTISAVSASDGSFGAAALAINGTFSQFGWAPAGWGLGDWFKVDLGSPKVVGEVALTSRNDDAFARTTSRFLLSFSDNASGPWTPLIYVNDAIFTAATQTLANPVPLYIAWSGVIPPPPATVTVSTASTNLAVANAGKYARYTNTGAKTLTVQPHTTVAQPTDAEFVIRNAAATGNLTVTAGAGVTVNAPVGGTLVIAPGGTAKLKHVDTDVYDLIEG